MAIRLPIDVATRVSAELSQLIERLVNDPDREEPPTLEDVRAALLRRKSPSPQRETEFLHPQDRTSALGELDGLIEEYGKEAPAADFVAAKASEGLSRVIEAAMGDPSLPDEPTLGGVRAAMVGGLTARLVGEGAIDPDDDGVLLAEIDELIRRYGAGVPAEPLVRFE
jgi:AcrR family transcriptional regulator